jgi:uncharacterized protein
VTLLYNFVMLAIDILVVWQLLRQKSLIRWFGMMTYAALAAIFLGIILGGFFEDHFGVFRLWAYGVFFHCVALLSATAVVWRKSRPRLAIAAFLSAAIGLLIAADAFLVEPHWLEVTHYDISSAKIKKPIKIVVIADLQTDRIGEYERKVMRLAMDENPDIILFAGDYIQSNDRPKQLWEELHLLLMESKVCEHAKGFAVLGNTGPGSIGMMKIFDGTGVNYDWRATRSYDLPEMRVTCLALEDSYYSRLAVSNPTPEKFHLVMGHSPNFALGKIDADLLVAGHTHGGQVRLPLIGPIITHSRVPLSWSAGLTDLPGGGKLVVSRGIGMELDYAPRMRFLCRPELAVIELTPDEKSD